MSHSLSLGALVQDEFKQKAKRVDRGVKQAGFYVISYTTMPSVLIELGFLTNKTEETFLQSDHGQGLMSSAVFRAFRSYKEQIEGVQTTVGTADAPPIDSTLQFKVQIATSSKAINLKPKNFKGIKGVSVYENNGLYKYTVGGSASLDETNKVLAHCREKGYEQAFIVAFKNGERIGLQEAINLAQVP